jgi:hypothetical protein
MTTRLERAAMPVFVVFLVACTGHFLEEEEGPAQTETGIRLDPPDGIGERALECEADHAPLRRLSHREYQRTMRDLFAGIELPTLMVAPDARRAGFTNNYESLAPSSLLVNQYFENARAIAAAAAAPEIEALDCAPSADCFRRFVAGFGERAYRRPLEGAEVDEYAAIYASGPAAGDFELSVEMAILGFLQSPAFVYRPELGGSDAHLTQHEIASRLSYFIWGTMPDRTLLDAANGGELEGDGLTAEVDRMLVDPRAREGLLSATTEWLSVDLLQQRLKADEYEFTDEVRGALRESLEMFLWERVFSETGSLDELLTSNGAYVNSTVGRIFGVADAGEEWEWRELDDRHGLLTHPALLAIHGYGTYPSPVRRGVFILTDLLCDAPSPPPGDVSMEERPSMSESGETLTNRQGYAELTQSISRCATCHDRINPLGFAFENYDTVGAYREMDNGYPIDASGSSAGFTLRTPFVFQNAGELTTQLNQSPRVRACIVDRWVRYATGGGSLAYDPCFRRELEAIASSPGASLRDIVIAIAIHPKFSAAEVVQ